MVIRELRMARQFLYRPTDKGIGAGFGSIGEYFEEIAVCRTMFRHLFWLNSTQTGEYAWIKAPKSMSVAIEE